MAVLVILSLILVRNLSVENPGKKQLLLETGVSFLQDFFMGILGEEGKQYVPYLMSLRLTEAFRNIGLYVGSVVITQYAGQPAADLFRKKLETLGIRCYIHYIIEGYPSRVTNFRHFILPR